MARLNGRARNKPKLDMVLLCIPSQFGLLKFGWELSGLVRFDIIWFCMDEFGLVWLISIWWFGVVEFSLVWMSLVWWSWFWFGMNDFGLVWLSSVCSGWVWLIVVEFGLLWMSLVWRGWVNFGLDEVGLVWLSLSLVGWGLFLFGLEDDLKWKVDTWMEENPFFFYTLREDDQDRNNKSNIR